ncbi:hypothetical protein LINPERPRIM_LOCUS19171 [Linum perenne]
MCSKKGTELQTFWYILALTFPLGVHSIPSSYVNLGFYLRYDCVGVTERRSIRLRHVKQSLYQKKL